MSRQCRLSHATTVYLETYEGILSEMIQGMTEAELTGSISDNFIVQMIPHHRGAVEMSKNALLPYLSGASADSLDNHYISGAWNKADVSFAAVYGLLIK